MKYSYITFKEWELFVGELSGGLDDNVVYWIPEDRRPAMCALSNHFPDLYRKLHLENEMEWYDFMSNTECEKSIPARVEESLSPFQILLTMQALRPDRLFTAMSTFARIALSKILLTTSALVFKDSAFILFHRSEVTLPSTDQFQGNPG